MVPPLPKRFQLLSKEKERHIKVLRKKFYYYQCCLLFISCYSKRHITLTMDGRREDSCALVLSHKPIAITSISGGNQPNFSLSIRLGITNTVFQRWSHSAPNTRRKKTFAHHCPSSKVRGENTTNHAIYLLSWSPLIRVLDGDKNCRLSTYLLLYKEVVY